MVLIQLIEMPEWIILQNHVWNFTIFTGIFFA